MIISITNIAFFKKLRAIFINCDIIPDFTISFLLESLI